MLPGAVPARPRNPFHCETACWRDGQMDDGERASRGCTRGDLPPVAWEIEPDRLRDHYLGRRRLEHEEIDPTMVDPETLPEHVEDGCPGGDQRSRFVQTLMRFYRRRDANGNRVANLMLDRCSDDLVLQAIAYYEAEQDACESHIADAIQQKAEEEARRHGT